VGEELELQDDEAFQRVIGVFEARRAHARAVMLDELRKPAYALLLDRLERELPDPHASGESVPLAEIARDEHRALVKTMRKIGDDPEDDVLHAARIRVKHARYAAELAQPAVGRPASRYISGAKRLQDILGDHQDATVARAELKGVAKLLDDPEVTDVVKRLRKFEKQRKRTSRETYPAAWEELQARGDAAWGPRD
jgi:CHAD domain-containing protein